VRLILDGTVVRVRLDRRATSISLLVVIGVREDGQKILLAVKNMGGETTEAWRAVLDDLIKRGPRRPQFLIMDGAAGLEKAIAAVWDGIPVTASSPSRACRRASGEARGQRTQSSGCMRSSSGGSRPRPSCPPPILLRCCSGDCLLPARSTCAKSMAGRPSLQNNSISRLTSPPDSVLSQCRRSRHTEFQHKSRRHRVKLTRLLPSRRDMLRCKTSSTPVTQAKLADPPAGLPPFVTEPRRLVPPHTKPRGRSYSRRRASAIRSRSIAVCSERAA
jgi:Transposase, Mutator family